MRFHAEMHISGPTNTIASLLADPTFYLGLELPDVGKPEVLDVHQDGTWSVFRLRYVVAGDQSRILRGLAGSASLAWLQDVRVDLTTGSGQLHYEAEFDPLRIYGTGGFTLTPDRGSTIFRFDGEVVVAVPGLGRLLEREIVHQLVNRLSIETSALDARLRRDAESDHPTGTL